MRTIEKPRIVCFATQGSGSRDEDRIRQLLDPLDPHVVDFRRGQRIRNALALLLGIRARDPDIVVMEGTGISGGMVLLLLRILFGTPYIVSSGDAVAPFIRIRSRAAGIVGGVYERALYRLSGGFIGWSPYLVGRALTFGAPRSMTAPNWSELSAGEGGHAIRRRLGIPEEALVFGIVGSLNWSTRYRYCYGCELVRAAMTFERDDLRILIVGDGDGRERLIEMAGTHAGRSILFPGPVPRAQVGAYLDAMDVASLPQSVDGVGAFRYTTKISEYLAASLPIVTGELPLAYDLDDGYLWRLPGDAPWDEQYLSALAHLMTTVTREELASRRPSAAHAELFDAERQRHQVSAFVLDVLDRECYRRPKV